MVRLTLIDGFIIGWLIYGNQLFFSSNNDCGAKPDTKFLYGMMFTLLALGYVAISVYFGILSSVLLGTIFSQEGQIPNQNKSDEKIKSILSSLSRIQFVSGKFDHDSQCGICLQQYKAMEMVTQLACDQRHYFHSGCLEKSIK